MAFRSYLQAALATTFNIVLNGLTLGRYIWLEGRVRRGTFYNWGRRFRYRPMKFAQPTTEEDIAALILNSKRLRVFGSGHSFNSGIVTDETLVSLDRYSGVIWKDVEKKQMAVKGGTRVRDINRALLEEGWAFAALPSHDAQSIAGIISTDVHGTGRDWGFVSQSVVRLKLINGSGEIIECHPTEDLFKAAIGGIGTLGIIVEVVVQAVDRFNVAQKTETMDRREIEQNLDHLLQENEHLSLYAFPFSDKYQVNTWNRTELSQSVFGSLREYISHSLDALVASWVGDLAAHTGILPKLSGFVYAMRPGTNLVMESNEAFNRSIYYLHQELEFTIPYQETFSTLERFVELYEELYSKGLSYTTFEVRFTPPGHNRTLLGAGRDRHCTWIDLVCIDSSGYERYYEAAEKLLQEIGARPHLGKYLTSIDRDYLKRVHGENFVRFRELIREHDPEDKFTNDFTRRLFEPDAE